MHNANWISWNSSLFSHCLCSEWNSGIQMENFMPANFLFWAIDHSKNAFLLFNGWLFWWQCQSKCHAILKFYSRRRETFVTFQPDITKCCLNDVFVLHSLFSFISCRHFHKYSMQQTTCKWISLPSIKSGLTFIAGSLAIYYFLFSLFFFCFPIDTMQLFIGHAFKLIESYGLKYSIMNEIRLRISNPFHNQKYQKWLFSVCVCVAFLFVHCHC